MFASLVLERAPLSWQDMPELVQTWLQVAGAFAAVALVVYGIVALIRGPARWDQPWPAWQRAVFKLAVIGMLACYILLGIVETPVALNSMRNGPEANPVSPLGSVKLPPTLLTLAGGLALFAVALPFIADLFRLRSRRIWALTRLSFKDAVRRKVVWVITAALMAIVMFSGWFLDSKPEHEVRNYVHVIYWAMTPLFLVAFGLLAAFGLPTDVRDQSIHTIVTKPVERFEIVLGRFLGYTLLMTVTLALVVACYVGFMFRGVSQDAQEESMRARVPLWGSLHFFSKKSSSGDFKGINVGREWEYRQYIAGTRSVNNPERAIWTYETLPSNLANRPNGKVRCEFSFDIFRTVKGEEGKGVFCTFQFYRGPEITRDSMPALEQKLTDYRAERLKALARPDADADKIDAELAEKYGLYEVAAKELVDYHTQDVEIPSALFKNEPPTAHARPGKASPTPAPALQVIVKLDSSGQYLGMARYDFYILDSEGTFAVNFLKGAVGLWLRVCVVIGLAVACSTYLSGVMSWLTATFIYVLGLFLEYGHQLAGNQLVGGGPMEAVFRLVNKESLVVPLQQTAGAHLAQGTDQVYRFILKCFLYLIPDVDRWDWTGYVAEGFNIGFGSILLFHTLLVFAYLFPCALVAYYLMKSREVASW
jgi:hypothetical protein